MREDERESREFGGVAMNGGLGLRTGSYGSLQQQQQLLQNSVAISIQCSPVAVRKQSKMTVAREKEKVLSRICKVVGRRRVGMLLLAITSLVVFVSILSVFSKDEVSESPDTYWPPLRSLSGFHRSPSILSKSPLIPLAGEHNLSLTLVSEIPPPAGTERELQGATPEVNTSIDFSEKYCEHFALSPPPADKKRTGPRPCGVCYIPVEHATNLMPTSPSISPLLQNLTYLSEGNSYANESNGGSLFGGHQSLQDRNDSFEIKESMSVHCGFYKGSKPGRGSGFDIDEMDLLEMEKCHGVVVASAIFGNYDILQQPRNISEMTKRNTCFFMFVDEETESYIKNSTIVDSSRKVGLWRLVIVRNLPYTDARRNGKVPKLLLHRLFPNVRYSLWIDGKLELVKDPYQILERFLWRKKATFAISRHYRRFDVFVEAEANKAAGKYDNATIDHQIEFYKNEGLTHYSEAKLPITSDVPEGCVIIREHIPITNLFTCFWFNEVDRFTSRDQISFSTVRDKIMARVNWNVSMFLDCERRNFVIQAYHRDLLEQKLRSLSRPPPPPLLLPIDKTRVGDSLPEPVPDKPAKTVVRSLRRGRDRRSGSRRHHPRTNGKDRNSI